MKALRIELVYFAGCPNVDAVREILRTALATEGLPIEWREWNRDDPATPDALRCYGSPTVLVNGRDIAPAGAVDERECCRVYAGDHEFYGVPPVATLRTALRQALTGKGDAR